MGVFVCLSKSETTINNKPLNYPQPTVPVDRRRRIWEKQVPTPVIIVIIVSVKERCPSLSVEIFLLKNRLR